jgi:hypothetical protein
MSHDHAPNSPADAERLDAATDQAIAACGGDIHHALKTMIVVKEELEAEVKYLRAAARIGSAREFIEQVPRDRRDWYD